MGQGVSFPHSQLARAVHQPCLGLSPSDCMSSPRQFDGPPRRLEGPDAPLAASPGLYGRTVATVNDLSRPEQMLLYHKARELKDSIAKRDDSSIQPFRLSDSQAAAYLIFME